MKRTRKKPKFYGDCWTWPYATDANGYGAIRIKGKTMKAHRWMYTLLKGEPPYNTEMDHLCRNRACINPEHLEAVSHQENVKRGRRITKLTPEDVIKIRKLSGKKTLKEIGAMFGVDAVTIWNIYHGKKWKDV